MSYGIVTNITKDPSFKKTCEMIQELESYQKKVYIAKEVYEVIQMGICIESYEDMYQTSDVIIVLGGDGTLLNTARYVAPYGKPMIGINLGNLGFLVEAESHMLKDMVKKLVSNDYKLEKRMMLEVFIRGEEGELGPYIGLNDAVISRGSYSRLVSLSVKVNGEIMDKFSADGMIIATPTGSTAYNLSAGGPILHPTNSQFVFTPICPHTLYSRPIVVEGSGVISISFDNKEQQDILLTIDGQSGYKIQCGDEVEIRQSAFVTTLIRLYPRSFYEILRTKMGKKQ